MEACYHTLKRKRSVEDLIRALEAAGIAVVPFDMDQAAEAARAAVGRWDFSTKARDYAIGSVAHVRKATMITENKRDFTWLPNVKSTKEAMASR
jgi:predicted nucleic acid-binding protein